MINIIMLNTSHARTQNKDAMDKKLKCRTYMLKILSLSEDSNTHHNQTTRDTKNVSVSKIVDNYMSYIIILNK